MVCMFSNSHLYHSFIEPKQPFQRSFTEETDIIALWAFVVLSYFIHGSFCLRPSINSEANKVHSEIIESVGEGVKQ